MDVFENKLAGRGAEWDEPHGAGTKIKYKIDDVLATFGGVGRFQVKILLITACMTFIAAWRILFDLFAVKHVPWYCTEAGIDAGCVDSDKAGVLPCEVSVDGRLVNRELDRMGNAEGRYWEYQQNLTSNSIVSTFGLSCVDTWKYDFVSSIFFIGAFFGVWMFGRLSDWIGRWKTLLISLAFCVVQGWVIAFVHNIDVYLACRFFDGAAFGGYFLVAFVLQVEYSPPKSRNIIGTSFHFITSVGMATVAVWGFLFQRWDYYAIALAVPPTLSIIAAFFIVPESPRWLLSKGRDSEALALLQAVADANGAKMPDNVLLYEDNDTQEGVKDVLKNKRLIMSSFINMFGWFMTSLVYYMLWFSAKYLAGNIYLNAFILGAAELPGRVAALFLMEKVGRKLTFMIAMALACVVMLCSIYPDATSRKIMYSVGKALTGTLWAVIYLYSAEMYPTKIRSLGSGLGSAAARIAALLAPQVKYIMALGESIPYIIVGILAFACVCVIWFLPETKNKDLPQTIDEFDNLFLKARAKDRQSLSQAIGDEVEETPA